MMAQLVCSKCLECPVFIVFLMRCTEKKKKINHFKYFAYKFSDSGIK